MAGSVLDVFNSNAFGMVSLTEGIDKLPYVPGRIGGMGLFRTEGIFNTTVKIEERRGKLTLVPIGARGVMPEYDTARTRTAKLFEVPHLPKNDAIMADDVANIRQFNSPGKMEAVSTLVADKLEQLKADQGATWEWHMAKCLSGQILDADGTLVSDWFTKFGITKKTVTISLGDPDSPKIISMEVRRHIIDALGGETSTGVHAFCNGSFIDQFSTHTGVKEAFARWQDGQFLRDSQAYNSANIFDIMWEEYRNVRSVETGTTVTDIPYIDHPDTPGDPVAYAFPIGTRNVFKRYNAPAPFIETVNTKGRDIYVKQTRDKWNTRVDLHTNSNPLFITQRPACIVEVLIGA